MQVKASIGILAAALVLTLSACEQQKKEESMDKKGMGATETGCCQHAESACAGDVTKSQCEQMSGKFQQGHMCRTDTGKCARE